MVGSSEGTSLLQLMSIPLASIDLSRTKRYADAVRAANYAVTRGEADYAAVTAEVASSLEALRQVSDPQRRLQLAEEARRRLLTWSRDHYDYRAAEVQELAGLFDDVIAELRAAAGGGAVSSRSARRCPDADRARSDPPGRDPRPSRSRPRSRRPRPPTMSMIGWPCCAPRSRPLPASGAAPISRARSRPDWPTRCGSRRPTPSSPTT